MNILITGSNGYIGSNLNKYLKDKYTITTINRQTFDLTNKEKTKDWFGDKFFDVVIHTAIKGGSRLVRDDSSVLDNNINMYYNILSCRDNFNRLINIGSGAEIYDPNSYYGLSKKIISSSILDKKNFYTLKIYGLFDEYELDSRFIKQNLKRYIKKDDIIIYKNKLMDFIYFQDFLKIIIRYIEDTELPKEIDCTYVEKFSLKDIAEIINQLNSYRVNIQILDTNTDKDYIGSPTPSNIAINFIGLKQGILNTYRKIKDEKNMVCP